MNRFLRLKDNLKPAKNFATIYWMWNFSFLSKIYQSSINLVSKLKIIKIYHYIQKHSLIDEPWSHKTNFFFQNCIHATWCENLILYLKKKKRKKTIIKENIKTPYSLPIITHYFLITHLTCPNFLITKNSSIKLVHVQNKFLFSDKTLLFISTITFSSTREIKKNTKDQSKKTME